MPHGTKVSTEKLSPSAFMRQLRPELYSDTIDRTTYQLDAPTLGYHLETITARNQTHDFEIFCRKLCERTIVRTADIGELLMRHDVMAIGKIERAAPFAARYPHADASV